MDVSCWMFHPTPSTWLRWRHWSVCGFTCTIMKPRRDVSCCPYPKSVVVGFTTTEGCVALPPEPGWREWRVHRLGATGTDFRLIGGYPPWNWQQVCPWKWAIPKGNDYIPTIHFQGRLLLVSGRVDFFSVKKKAFLFGSCDWWLVLPEACGLLFADCFMLTRLVQVASFENGAEKTINKKWHFHVANLLPGPIN